MFKVMLFCLHACTQPLSPLTNCFNVLWYACLCVSDALHQFKSMVLRTCVLYNVHTFLYQSANFVGDQVSGSTGLFGGHRSGEIESGCFLLKELDRFRSIECHQNTSFLSQLFKSNTVSNNEETRKVEYVYHFWRCADAGYRILSKLVHTCWNCCLP